MSVSRRTRTATIARILPWSALLLAAVSWAFRAHEYGDLDREAAAARTTAMATSTALACAPADPLALGECGDRP